MIQFNLLPDIKIQYIKTQRTKHMLLVISVIAAGAAIGLLLILFSFLAVQKKHISDLDKDISSLSSELKSEPELTRMLSIQSQLNVLNSTYSDDGIIIEPGLYDKRPALTRLPGYLDQITPVGAGMRQLTLDLAENEMEIIVQAPTLELMYNHVDTLKYTELIKKVQGEEDEKSFAFSSVVLSNFGKSDEGAVYTISFIFDPAIFDSTQTVELVVPSLVTTHVQAPSAELFTGSAPERGSEQ